VLAWWILHEGTHPAFWCNPARFPVQFPAGDEAIIAESGARSISAVGWDARRSPFLFVPIGVLCYTHVVLWVQTGKGRSLTRRGIDLSSSLRYRRALVLLIVVALIAVGSLAGCGLRGQANQVASAPTPPSTATPLPTATHPPSTPSPTARPSPTPLPTPLPQPSATPIPTPVALPTAPTYTYRVVNAYPHDRGAFTQGLVIEDGILYEGTGLYGRSSLRRVDLDTGEVLQIYRLPDQLFGEGITVYDDKIVQLTWKSQVGFVYDRDTFDPLREFSYPTEGWGLTHDGEHLIMSDGTATLHFLDPETFQEVERVTVYDDRGPVVRLNELEYVHGTVYANVWQTDRVALIAPESGQVTGWIDLSGLLSAEEQSQGVDVLNGIAYDAARDRLVVTGKLWPRMFEIQIVPQSWS
jgi:glutamine cyclotransferase